MLYECVVNSHGFPTCGPANPLWEADHLIRFGPLIDHILFADDEEATRPLWCSGHYDNIATKYRRWACVHLPAPRIPSSLWHCSFRSPFRIGLPTFWLLPWLQESFYLLFPHSQFQGRQTWHFPHQHQEHTHPNITNAIYGLILANWWSVCYFIGWEYTQISLSQWRQS